MGSKPKTTRAKIHEPQGKAIIFDFPLSGTTTFSNFWTFSTFLIFCFWFLSLVSCLPADEATAKSVTKYSPTDSEKQTAVVCKDNGHFFFDKAFAMSKTIHVSQDPARAAVARYARNGACLVCVIPTT